MGTDYFTVFYVKMIANQVTPPNLSQPGQRQALVVAGDPADAGSSLVVLTPTDRNSLDPFDQLPVTTTDDQVFLRPTSFAIYLPGEAEFTNTAKPQDVDLDGQVSASDVLAVINNINANGSRSLVGLTPGP